MSTSPWSRPITIPAFLIDARDFKTTAGLRSLNPRALAMAGHLTPINIGSRTYYDRRELLAFMPDWAREQHEQPAAQNERASHVTGSAR